MAAALVAIVVIAPGAPESRAEEHLAQAPAVGPEPPAPAAPAAPTPAATARPAAATQTDSEVLFTLLRTTLVALHQANVTGNYTVLRDLAAPGFRDRNSAAELARIFTPIRDAKIDLSAVVLLDPQLSKATLNEQKMLYLVGSLATKPIPVSFELLFQPIEGVWRVFGIAVTPAQQAGAPASLPTQAQPAAGKRSPAAAKPNLPAKPKPQP